MKDEKEEIKPAPLGEEFGIIDLSKCEPGVIVTTPKSLGESCEEQKRKNDIIFKIADQLWDKWAFELGNYGRRMTKDLFTLAIQDELLKELHSPTSEPPEEQEELWINIQDRLPEKEGQYLTYRANKIMIVEHWFKKDSKFLWGNCYGVTHWMPLPNPPQKRLNT